MSRVNTSKDPHKRQRQQQQHGLVDVKAFRARSRLLTVPEEDEVEDSPDDGDLAPDGAAACCHRHHLPRPSQEEPNRRQQRDAHAKHSLDQRHCADYSIPERSPSLTKSLVRRMSEASTDAVALARWRIELEKEQELERQRRQPDQQQQQRHDQERRVHTDLLALSPSPSPSSLSGNEPVTEETNSLNDDVDTLVECTRQWNEANLSPITSHNHRSQSASLSPIQNNLLAHDREDAHHQVPHVQDQVQANSLWTLFSSPSQQHQQQQPTIKFCDHCGHRFGVFRRIHVCHLCEAQVCRACCCRPAKVKLVCHTTPPMCQPCAMIFDWEALLLSSRLPSLALVQSAGNVCYAPYASGTMRPVYRSWIKKSPPRHLFCANQSKRRNQFLLNNRVAQLLNLQVWNSYVSHVAMHINNITNCFLSLLQEDEQLIVCQSGKITPFTMFPRAISICEYTIWSESGMLIPQVANDPAFANNPMLKLLDAEFYYGVPVYCHDVAIGTLAIVDSSPHDTMRAEDMQLLKITSDAIGKRLHRLIKRVTSKKKQ